ncbi:MAG: AsmA family protein [Arenicellales bacterium]|nr:AsmA family protein [Arenicellales bacterium]
MNKFLKIVGIAAAAVVGLVAVAIIVLKLISDDQYKEWIASAVQSATGRDFAIETLELDLTSSLLVKASDIRLGNAEWSDHSDMLTVGQLEAEVGLLSLLGGVADVRAVIEKANVVSETDKNGTSNWQFDTASDEEVVTEKDTDVEPKDEAGLPIRPYIREFRISDLTLAHLDGATGSEKNAAIKGLEIIAADEDFTVELTGSFQSTPITLSGNLGHMDDLVNNASTPIRLDTKVGGTTLNLSGSWGPLLPDLTAALALDLDVPSTVELTDLAGVELADLGQVQLDANLSADQGRFSVSELTTNLDHDYAGVVVQGNIGDLIAVKEIELNVEANTAALGRLLERLNVAIPTALPPDLKASAVVAGNLDQLSVKDIKVESRDEGIQVQVTGLVNHALGPEGIDAVVKVEVDSLAALSKYAKLDLPDLGALDLSGKVSSADKTFRLENLDAQLKGESLTAQVQGGVGDLMAVNGIDATVDLELGPLSPATVTELERLLKQQDIDIPLILPTGVKVNAGISGGLDQLGVNDISAEVLDEGIDISVTGAVSNALIPEGVDATFNVKVDTLAALSKYANTELPAEGALDISGQVVSENKTYRLANLDAKLGGADFDVGVQGTVNDLLKVSGINAELKAEIASLSALSTLAKTELPATDAITMTGKVSAPGGDKGTQTSLVVNVESNGAKVTVDGDLSDLQSFESVDVDIAVNASSLSDFSKFAQRELPEQGPFNLTGTIHAQPNEYRLDDFQMTLDQQKIDGNIGIVLADNETAPSLINGQLNIPFLDLSPLITPEPSEEMSDQTQVVTEDDTPPKKPTGKRADGIEEVEETEEVAADRLFLTDPLPVDALKDYDADISVTADRLKVGKVDFTEMDIKLSLKDGLLRVDPINSIAGDGTIAGAFELDARSDPTKLSVDVKIDDAPMPRLGGGLDFNLDLDGTGKSMAELMGGLNGQVLIVMRDGRLEKSLMTGFGTSLTESINPLSKDDPYTTVECAILRMEIEDGMVNFERKLAMQTTKVTWRGGGDINLKTEGLDVGIAPKARTGLGISAGSLASLIHIGGTLKKPAVKLDPTDVALKYGKYMAAVSTGGISILAEGLLNRTQANVDVCAQILDGTVFDEEAVEEEAALEKGADTQSTSQSGQESEVDQQETQGEAMGTEKEAESEQAVNVEQESESKAPEKAEKKKPARKQTKNEM